MANVNAPFGLRPIGRSAAGGCVQTNIYPKIAGTATIIYQNDVVRHLADGITAGGTPGTDLFLGVALNYGAASTATTHLVIDDPLAIFEVQDDGTTNSTAGVQSADLGLNVNFVFTAGDATLRRSKHQIATSTKDTTNTLDAKILRRVSDFGIIPGSTDTPGNAWGQYCRVEIQFNKHMRAFGVAGV